MRKSVFGFVFGMASLFMVASSVNAQDDPVSEALQDCSTEIQSYCSSVTPGEGRLVSCAKAHEDKLSPQCIGAINRAGYWLDYLASTLAYVVTQCEADALKYCPNVELGERRVLNCLEEKQDNLSKYCGIALKDIGQN